MGSLPDYSAKTPFGDPGDRFGTAPQSGKETGEWVDRNRRRTPQQSSSSGNASLVAGEVVGYGIMATSVLAGPAFFIPLILGFLISSCTRNARK